MPDKLLWEYPWKTFSGINVAQPIVFQQNGHDLVFLSASYGAGAAVFELTRGRGRLSDKKGVGKPADEEQVHELGVPQRDIYGLDESILASVDAITGEQNWKGGRTATARSCWPAITSSC